MGESAERALLIAIGFLLLLHTSKPTGLAFLLVAGCGVMWLGTAAWRTWKEPR